MPRTPDAYFVELDVDEWGFLDGGDDLLTDEIPDWSVPFSAVDAILDLNLDAWPQPSTPQLLLAPEPSVA